MVCGNIFPFAHFATFLIHKWHKNVMFLFTNDLTLILLGTSSTFYRLLVKKWYFTQKVFLKSGWVSQNKNNKWSSCFVKHFFFYRSKRLL